MSVGQSGMADPQDTNSYCNKGWNFQFYTSKLSRILMLYSYWIIYMGLFLLKEQTLGVIYR